MLFLFDVILYDQYDVFCCVCAQLRIQYLFGLTTIRNLRVSG